MHALLKVTGMGRTMNGLAVRKLQVVIIAPEYEKVS